MALNRRRTTRRARVYLLRAARFVGEVLSSFLNFKEEDGLAEKGEKILRLVARRAVYFVADYSLTALSAVIVVGMKTYGFSFWEAFLAMWAFDFVTAGAFILVYEKTGEDLSLGEDFRRAVDVIHTRSRLVGYLTMAYVIGKAIVLTGPEKVVTFFRKEIGTITRVVLILVALTAVQAVIWTVLYGVGYDLVVKLF